MRDLGSGALLCALVAVLHLAAAPVARTDEGSVRILRPAEGQPLLGWVRIVVAPEPPEGESVEWVRILVDGDEIARLTAGPWEVRWDAGEGTRPHRIRAEARFSGGSTAGTEVRTEVFRATFEADVFLVTVYAVVQDEDGRYVQDLKAEEFRIFDDGEPQKLAHFSRERKPLRVALVLDTSLTMAGRKLARAKQAARSFLSVLEPGDEATLFHFNDRVERVEGPTDDVEKLARAIESLEAAGGTALYDAVYKGSKSLGDAEGRKVLVLLSDGGDQSSSGLEPGSFHTLAEAQERALRDEVIVFAIGFGRNLDSELDFYRRRTLKDILELLARETGGRALFPSRFAQLRRAFRQVAEDLRNQYSLSYSPDALERNGRWHRLEVRVTRPGHTVVARRGYYEPGGETSENTPSGSSGGGAAAGPINEDQVAQVDHDAGGLSENEDRVLPVDGVGEKQGAAGER